jgi:hypothetical protein
LPITADAILVAETFPITSNGGATHHVAPAMDALGMPYDPGARSS